MGISTRPAEIRLHCRLAFPNCVNTWHHNFFPAGTSSRQDIPVLPTQTNRTCQANKETQPESNVAENLSEQVSELFLFLGQVQYFTWHSNKIVYTVGKCAHHNWNGKPDCSRYPILWTTGGNLVRFSVAFEGNDVLHCLSISSGIWLTLRAASNEGATNTSSLNPRLMRSWRVLRLDVIFSTFTSRGKHVFMQTFCDPLHVDCNSPPKLLENVPLKSHCETSKHSYSLIIFEWFSTY